MSGIDHVSLTAEQMLIAEHRALGRRALHHAISGEIARTRSNPCS
jgi:hypothetical protein